MCLLETRELTKLIKLIELLIAAVIRNATNIRNYNRYYCDKFLLLHFGTVWILTVGGNFALSMEHRDFYFRKIKICRNMWTIASYKMYQNFH